MAKNKHVYLVNGVTSNNGFKKTRNIQPTLKEEEVELLKYPNVIQQQRLSRAKSIFTRERTQRAEKKTINVPTSLELISINFYKTFNQSLSKEFYKRYGLTALVFENFNKGVLFEITDTNLFGDFIKHVELYCNSSVSVKYEGKSYNLIALVHNFEFLSSNKRIKSIEAGLTALSLVTSSKNNSIYTALLAYLKEQNKEFFSSTLSSEFIEVANLSKEDIITIADNFDIVKSVTSSRTERRRPGVYGEERREYGFDVSLSDNLPLVAVVDSGLSKIEPLKPAISNHSIDLTNTSGFIDDCGHGTAVSGLVMLGHEFLTEVKETYHAKAKVFIIKAISQNNDELNIISIIEAIKKARIEYGIRLFNLCLNTPIAKPYNTGFSDYAYLLDKLAFEHDLLIFTSVGNISDTTLKELLDESPHIAHDYPTIFYSPDNQSDIHSCESTNILEPSESLNNVSVGALAGNLEKPASSDITPADELPAYYTRKFHFDFEQKINGVKLIKSQRNKHINKPDLVFDGGDLFKPESGIEILKSNIGTGEFFGRDCGTSLATPLVTSMAAEIMRDYPTLRTQTIKAILLNSSNYPLGNEPFPFDNGYKGLFKKLMGFGKPEYSSLLYSDDNAVTFVIEGDIKLDELKTIVINLPAYFNKDGNKLNFKSTLCYSFLPLKDNHLSYLPLQITYGIFKPIDAQKMGPSNTKEYIIKSGMTWSDDFFGVDNRLFSNAQQLNHNVSGEQIAANNNKVTLAIKCTAKNEIPDSHKIALENQNHKFSVVIKITELPVSKVQHILYNEMIAINDIEAINNLEGFANADLDA